MRAASLPTVFIPAALCDAALYRDVIVALGGKIAAHVLLSPKPSLADSVADILARAPPMFALVGTSYGGTLALEVALAAPERVAAIWLMGCDPAGPKPGGSDFAARLEADPAAAIAMLAGLVVHKDAVEARSVFEAMAQRVGGAAGAAQARAMSGRTEVISRLGTLTMPALLLWGEDDPLVPPAIGRSFAAALPNARFHTLAGCGHLPTLEMPSEAAALFDALLDEAEALSAAQRPAATLG